MNARSLASKTLASMVVLVTMLLVLGLGSTGANAAPVAAGGQVRPAAAGLAGATPGRQVRLMVPECQLEQASLRCEKGPAGQWHCACKQAALAANTLVLSLVLPAEDVTWPPRQRSGLAAR